MTTPNGNIFRQARQLLRDKSVLELNGGELEVVKIATMPLLLLRMFNDKPIDDGLKELAKIVEEAKQNERSNLNRSVNYNRHPRHPSSGRCAEGAGVLEP